MKRLCLAFLLLASIAKAETDTRAFGAINDIQKGRHNQNAIEDLYVTDDGLIRDDLTVLGDEIVGGNLVVTGTVTSTGSSSGGNATFNNITVRTNSTVLGSQIVGTTLTVSGRVSNAGFTSVGASTNTGNLRVEGDLTVTNQITVNNLTAQGLISANNQDASGVFRSLSTTVIGDGTNDTCNMSASLVISNTVTLSGGNARYISNQGFYAEVGPNQTVTNNQQISPVHGTVFLQSITASNNIQIANPQSSGQQMNIVFISTNTISVPDSGNLKLNGAFNGTQDDVLRLVGGHDGAYWSEASRSAN